MDHLSKGDAEIASAVFSILFSGLHSSLSLSMLLAKEISTGIISLIKGRQCGFGQYVDYPFAYYSAKNFSEFGCIKECPTSSKDIF